MDTTSTDLVAAAGLVRRTVRHGNRDGAPTHVVTARRTYATDQADLWDAVTNPERLPRWFLPVTGDLEVGGRYQLEGNAGGVIEHCDPPRRLAVTWEMGGGTSWVTVSLSPTGDGTTLELEHEAPVDPGFWEQYGPGAVGVGWDLALTLGLALHVASGEAVDPEWAAAYTLSPEGVAVVERAATGWADAAVAAGDDPDDADAAARRTVAFYTTVPDEAPQP